MSEKRFEKDCDENVCSFDYSTLDTYYEYNVSNEEIIEWNKHSSNAQYRNLKHIAEILNIKQMRLESLMKHREEIGKLFDRIDEQQATIQRMKHSLNTIYKSFEKKFGYDMRNAIWLIDEISYEEWEDKLHIAETDAMNHKESSMYWKNKCDEQQATITALNEKIEQRNALLDKIEKALGEPIEEWLLGVKYR